MFTKFLSLRLMVFHVLLLYYWRFTSKPSQLLIKLFYNDLANLVLNIFKGVTCLNYGFSYLEPGIEHLKGEEYLQKQLYYFLISQYPDKINKALEVGSGLGGGAVLLASKDDQIEEMLGVELAPRSVKTARMLHSSIKNLKFLQGNAENIPIDSASMDLVVNVESSHCYPKLSHFFNEVSRVLKPDGKFLITDYRFKNDIAEFEKLILNSGFVIENKIDITENVKASLIKDSDRKKNVLLKAKIPNRLKKFLEDFAACEGTEMYNNFMNDRYTYFVYKLKKV